MWNNTVWKFSTKTLKEKPCNLPQIKEKKFIKQHYNALITNLKENSRVI